MNGSHYLLNLGIKPGCDARIARLFHQVNALNIVIVIIAWTAAAFLNITGISTLSSFVLTAVGLYHILLMVLTAKEKLDFVRKAFIYSVEIHLFIQTFIFMGKMDNGFIYSTIILCYCLFPVIAGLLELPIIPHVFIALAQIAVFFIVSFFYQDFLHHLIVSQKIAGYSVKPEIVPILEAIYLPIIIGAVAHIMQKENKLERRKTEELLGRLKRSNTELEQFAYVASHDLQEPLRMVASYVKLLEKRNKDKLDADSIDFINFAVDGAIRMQRLINDLLTYSRVSTKGKPFEVVKCNTVFEATIKNLEVAIREKKAVITHDFLPELKGDEGQLVQLFQNLIGNALKFCKDRTPGIRITAKQEARAWVFGVHDNGIGIAPENHERVFQIFQRLHSREEYEGTGIGLAVCKKIVERHGGRIWVESEVKKGTTIWFTLHSNNEAIE
ncbi:MAG: hypothetical protein A2268_02555 [Candidatus Raymondbacteria bacterium RifOxyA12_full_50_37]|uniref:histidine kinase n=1 Tax=Candidatus Raymondbacteria bacterium RIFOXYD12_FULL_49_13 TaxID=1817890 RepID=A0A1F7FEN6_UNCRA|nr:MAG: hypothetical protein A2268_02555 [Candidatus Raymondbacteria bacterium RifOxyA12_full_50_37]OGJ89120.1 MAG: hypothetical protein A2248_11210 [Candidatus Raymondbacteria bacterium RIFOXYA2_FULL_49_16]OGJ96602.1 MAG: hypothetical protein A2453_06325 [Candidatus Raymondbacteria bacterium RIFOXYC2_FULL_50_21]OGK03181.1 MAG: hypothetical protein A2350_13900 [Candidatus Raymondbacteria bacterium RifOxyB12_full_50_8]OGK05160.1 MAG: hypothetical protein A2519_11475 [Candidatus Raymondbacteria b